MLLALGIGCSKEEPDDASTPIAVACQGSAVLSPGGGEVRVDLPGCGGVFLDELRIVGEGSMRLELFSSGTQLIPQIIAEGDATFEALHFSGTWWSGGEADPAFWRQGYQSWSASGVFPLAEVVRDARGLPLVGGHANSLDVLNEAPFTSWWAGLAGRPEGGVVLAGTVSARQTKTWVAFGPEEMHVVWGGAGEQIALEAGDEIYLDPLFIGIGGDADSLWKVWAEQVATTAPPRVPEAPLTGWASWYEHYADVSEDDVRANLAVAASLDPGLAPLDVLQIDDGWSVAWGDWTANERFPSGMAVIAAEIEAEGLIPGIWMAPFLVDRSAPVYLANADWWVRGADGETLDDMGYAVLDATQPDAAAWLSEQIAARVAEGFDYLKLDFLYAGAAEGVRYAPVTGSEAYGIGMTLVREAAGDAWVLACGAPMLPTVGFAESWRSGPDIAFSFDPDPKQAFLRNQARTTAARSFLNGLWWWNDADQILVREPFSELEARGAVVANAVSGGMWMLGDDLVGLPAARLAWALDPDAVATAGAVAVPAHPLTAVSGFDTSPLVEATQGDDAVPVRWDLSDGTVALLNLGTTDVQIAGPGGTELLTGETAGEGTRTLAPGQGELWRP